MATVRRFFQPPPSHYFLFGPRGTGKSTWLASTYPDALRIDLLAPEIQRSYAARPERLRETLAGRPDATVVVIDEVQRAPALLDVVHEQIEARPGGPRFVLTGSSARKLRRAGVNLLAGRAASCTLHPFLAAELGPAFHLDRALTTGLVPLVWASQDPARTRAAYLDLYLREEVQAEGIVRDLSAFSRFVEAVSLSHARQINVAAIARECEVGRKTVEGYLGVLEDLLLAFQLPVFTRKAKRRLVNHPKFFWFDAGVFRSARPAGPLDQPEEIAGAALEGLVAQHLRAWIAYSNADLSLSYWRTKSGSEVDFVVYGSSGFWALEVKNSRKVHPGDLRGLKAFRDEYPIAGVGLVYRGTERLEIDGIPCIPVEEFLLGLGEEKGAGAIGVMG